MSATLKNSQRSQKDIRLSYNGIILQGWLEAVEPEPPSEIARLLLERGGGIIRWVDFAPMLQIVTSGTVAPFLPYDYQFKLIETIEANRNTIVCKSRQLGISETLCSWLLMRAVTEPGFTAVVFNKTGDDASDLGDRIRKMAISLGELCPEFESENKRLVGFKGLGRIYFLPPTARAARGIPSASVVVFDEAAFINNIELMYQSAMPTLSMLGDKGKVILNSTPNGKTGLFWKLLSGGVGQAKHVLDQCDIIRSQVANNTVPIYRHTRFWHHKAWAKVLLHWRQHPLYGADPNWATQQREQQELTEGQWNQEFELDFGTGNNAIFDPVYVERCKTGAWQEPIKGRKYMVAIDPNFGGDDPFEAQVWDITAMPISLVAEYRESYKSKQYNLGKTYNLVNKYKPVLCAVETNSGGKLHAEDIAQEYPDLRVEIVNHSNTSKIVNTDRIVLMTEREEMIFPSDCPIGEEMCHFIEETTGKTRTRHAENGWHDDTVMCAAVMGAWLETAIAIRPPIRSQPIGSTSQTSR